MSTIVVSAFSKPDVRNKIFVTLGLLLIYRLGALFPSPGVNYDAVQSCVATVSGNSFYDFVSLFGGGALLKLSVFALGAIPYIMASIVMQLLGVIVPKLAQLRVGGQAGKDKLTQYTRYVTVVVAIFQSFTLVYLISNPGFLFQGCNNTLLSSQGVIAMVVLFTTLVVGALVVMWLGELITEKGFGNGISLIIFVSIAAALPASFMKIYQAKGIFSLIVIGCVTIFIIMGVVFVEQAQRRIPIQYQLRSMPGMISRASSYLPLKLNMAGIVPVIFASSVLSLPLLAASLFGSKESGWGLWTLNNLSNGTNPIYLFLYAILIVFFVYFYTAVTFDAHEVSDQLNKDGAFVPGYRPGEDTENYFIFVINRLTLPGSIYLVLIAVVPTVVFGSAGFSGAFIFGGTSILILVGVALDTIKQFNASIKQHKYEGLLSE